jgi:hypothetical protein
MYDRTVDVDDDVGGAATDIDEHAADLPLVAAQDRVRAGERLQHDLFDEQPATLCTLGDVSYARRRGGHHVHARFETNTGHADRLFDTVLLVDNVLLWEDVNHLAVTGQRHGLGLLEHTGDVFDRDLAVRDGGDPVLVHAAHMASGDAGIHRVDLDTGHRLGLLDRRANRLDGRLDVDDDAFLQTL